jgi:hypothetical protein
LFCVACCAFFADAGLVSTAATAKIDKTNFVFGDFIVLFSRVVRAA